MEIYDTVVIAAEWSAVNRVPGQFFFFFLCWSFCHDAKLLRRLHLMPAAEGVRFLLMVFFVTEFVMGRVFDCVFGDYGVLYGVDLMECS